MTRNSKHKRCRTGCLTCRNRRLKCDENRPECNRCVKSQRACVYGRSAPKQDGSLQQYNGLNKSTNSSPELPPGKAVSTQCILNFDVAQKAGISTSSGVLDVHCPSPERFQIHPDSKSPVFLPPNGKRSSLGCKKLELSSPVCPLTGAIHDLVEFHRRTISSADYFLERQWYHEELFMKELPRIAKGWCSLAYAMAAFATLHYYKKAGPTTSVYITALTCYENAVRKLYDSLFKDPDSIDESLARVATALSLSAFERVLGFLENSDLHLYGALTILQQEYRILNPKEVVSTTLGVSILDWYLQYENDSRRRQKFQLKTPNSMADWKRLELFEKRSRPH